MTDTIAHRGPDSDGTWSDREAGIWLGHRRLAIVDLSTAGAQPMVSASDRYVITYNGEIYNHSELRAELERCGMAPTWRGHSDTESLLAGFDAWGIEETVRRSTGMFAFAVWDRRERTLTLARDRIGEKPLYYAVAAKGRGPVFLFGSELKALREHPAFPRSIDRNALSLFLRHGYIGGRHTIYEGCRKLLPGCLLTISRNRPEPRERRYWSAPKAALDRTTPTERMSEKDAVDALENLLSEAIGRQMVADVPVGAFLSGGIDSSTVVALMRKWTSRPVHTFSIGFRDPRYDEAEHAKRVAAHLGTRHTELYVDAADLLEVVPALPRIYDEPFGDSSQIPTILVSRLARRHVTVALSGDGGDELFCGYDRYRQIRDLWRLLRRIPPPARRLLSQGIRSVAVPAWNALATPLHPGMGTFGQRLGRIATYVDGRSAEDIHRNVISFWSSPPVIDAREPLWALTDPPALPELGEAERMMMLDLMTYLPEDILAKVDRAAMSTSLETRAPLLDHCVAEFALRLPLRMKLRGRENKWALRQVLARHVPRAITDRPKQGFSVPIGEWLRGPLREWAESLLASSRLRDDGYLDAASVRQTWSEHLSGRFDWRYRLWNILMFQAWKQGEDDELSARVDHRIPA